MKKRLAGLGLLAIVLMVSLMVFRRQNFAINVSGSKNFNARETLYKLSLSDKLKRPNINFGNAENGDFKALRLTQQFILENLDRFPIQQHHRLRGETLKSPLGTLVSYKVYQDGVPILGIQLDFRVNSRNQVLELFNGYQPVVQMKVEPDKWMTIEQVAALQSSSFKKVESDSKTLAKPNIIWVESGSDRAHWGYVLKVVDLLQKKKAPEQAIFSAITGQLLAREVSRGEFNRLPRP